MDKFSRKAAKALRKRRTREDGRGTRGRETKGRWMTEANEERRLEGEKIKQKIA
jgi:hypothetical protein